MSPDDLPPTPGADPTPTIEPAPGLPGYVAGSAPVPVGRGPRRISGILVGVAIALVAVIGGGALFMSGYALGVHQGSEPGTAPSDDAAFQPFWDAYHNVTSRFALGPVDRTTVVEGAIKGMVDALGDPYSTYLSPEDFQNTLQDINGQFEGIGAEIATVDATGKTSDCTPFGPNCFLQVAQPLPDSPALKAGLQTGDIVTAVDHATLDGLTSDQARDKIRGKAGTAVVLTIKRGSAAPFDVSIVRAQITRQEVTTKDLAGGSVGYVQLMGFSETGADAAVAAIKADVAKGQKKLILDLRGNPGGFVDAATRLASAFIASGPVYWEQDSDGNQVPTDAIAGGAATDPSIRAVVLVDGGSASASEIVTGALHDTGRATVVGQQSFGKGTVQTWIPLGNNGDEGGIKLTIAKWLTPDKTWIHHVGITPDVVVTVPANLPAGQDPILDAGLAAVDTPAPSGPPPAQSGNPGSLPPSVAPSVAPASSSRSFLVGWVEVS
ncbi:MAG TPA: S41 family peptidase [Candidatus Limnocylindrales bacterium]